MTANPTECSMLKQRSVIKNLVDEKCKLYEIYKRIYDVYRKACFTKKKKELTNGLNMGLPR